MRISQALLSCILLPILTSLTSCAYYPSGNVPLGNRVKKQHEQINAEQLVNPNNLEQCPLPDKQKPDLYGKNGETWKFHNCWGSYESRYNNHYCYKYIGEFISGSPNGYGVHYFENGDTRYIGKFSTTNILGIEKKFLCSSVYMHGTGILQKKSGDFYLGNFFYDKFSGDGLYITNDGYKQEGAWKDGKFLQEKSIESIRVLTENFLPDNIVLRVKDRIGQVQKLAINKISLQIFIRNQNEQGEISIEINTNADTASLKINGEEQGGRSDGKYSVKKIARAGGDTQFTIVATDTNGKTDTKTITVSRPIDESKPLAAALNPAQVKQQPSKDAVAVIIGIADYKNLPRADFANDDARVFYDYAIRALGVKPENIKLLVDADADDVAIYRAFKTWLPSRVRNGTDVYVYYSGHGLPTADGKGLYLLPQRADRDFLDKTAITQAEINAAIQAAKPRSVTVFLDSCYSGQSRSGETLIASARPVALKAEKQLFPDNFTVITASQADQISSSSPDLKHGIFSYYLMRGMEGDADANRDGKITAGEMQAYLAENVARQAGMQNRVQQPQLIGDANRVLVGR
jgi:uncharacterized caspase-like protein